jgi:hypothetical protein
MCRCPAHFHAVEKDQHKFPDNFAQLISGNNITSQDINFNCMLGVWKLTTQQNIQEIAATLKEFGIEILSMAQRQLTAEEAFFIRDRVTK